MTTPEDDINSAVLKLSELLHDLPGNPDTLLNHLHFAFDAQNNVSTVEVKFVEAGAAPRDLTISLPGVNLTLLGASDGEIVQHLIEQARLHFE